MLIVEDVAYKELSFDGSQLPSLWSLGPDVVLQAGTFSKIFCPGTRLGWAVGPAALIAQLASAKGGTDQCAGALGQRLVEEYGRAGHFGRRLPHARALYESHWVALSAALERHMPEGVAWSEPTGGMFTWLRMPEGLDARALRPAATEAGVAYVPGAPFYVDERRRERDAAVVQRARRGAARGRGAAARGRDRRRAGHVRAMSRSVVVDEHDRRREPQHAPHVARPAALGGHQRRPAEQQRGGREHEPPNSEQHDGDRPVGERERRGGEAERARVPARTDSSAAGIAAKAAM